MAGSNSGVMPNDRFPIIESMRHVAEQTGKLTFRQKILSLCSQVLVLDRDTLHILQRQLKVGDYWMDSES